MSTNDVPGASKANADELHAGVWAEHADGSLIYVKGTEGDRVVYEIYDMGVEPPVSYTDAMPAKGFKSQFSFPPVGKSKEKWTWHDKTPFPWDRVMRGARRPRPSFATAEDHLTAAARVAESLNLRAREVRDESVRHNAEQSTRRGFAIMDKLSRALGELRR